MRLDLVRKARLHWEEWLPQKCALLKKEGNFRATLQTAAQNAQDEMERLRQAGARPHEAEEVALREYILLPPEPGAGIPKDQQEELAEMEREYQKNPWPVLGLDPDDDLVLMTLPISELRYILKTASWTLAPTKLEMDALLGTLQGLAMSLNKPKDWQDSLAMARVALANSCDIEDFLNRIK